jgi:hypothetical protein
MMFLFYSNDIYSFIHLYINFLKMQEVGKVLHSQGYFIFIYILITLSFILILNSIILPNRSDSEFGDPFEQNLFEASGYVIDAFGEEPSEPNDGKNKPENKPKVATRSNTGSKSIIDTKPKTQAKITKVPKGPPPEKGSDAWYKELAKKWKNDAERGKRTAAKNEAKRAFKKKHGMK